MSERAALNIFGPVEHDRWLGLIRRDGSADAEGALAALLYEGIKTRPLYHAADLKVLGERYSAEAIESARPHRAGATPLWQAVQLLDHLSIEEANRQLLEDIANDVSGVFLQLGGNIPYGGAYIGARTAADLLRVLDGAPLDRLSIYLSGGFDVVPGAAMLLAAAEAAGVAPAELKGAAGFDPLTIIAASGYVPAERGEVLADAVDAAHFMRGRGLRLLPFLASGRAWHQAGGSAVHELAYALAASVAYWRALEASGFPLDEAIGAVGVTLTADCDLFLTIAKFRAARLLWGRAAQACGHDGAAPPLLMAEMSYRTITERDAYNNMLRATAAVFGAAIGEADAILVIPFNTRAGTPDAFARRMARNTHHILAQEAHLGQVSDAAGGSWYLEALTHELAAAAWREFQSVEASGGLLRALEQGQVGDAIAAVRTRRERNVATARDAITGVSSFPDLNEKPVSAFHGDAGVDLDALNREDTVPDLPPPGRGERFAAMIEAAKAGASLRGLERALERIYERRKLLPSNGARLAEPFERLRRASDAARARIGARPPVFIAALGTPADFTARLTHLRSVLESGGFEPLSADGLAVPADLERAFRDSPAPVACLCASNKVYEDWPRAAETLKAAGAAAVYLAVDPEGLARLPPACKRGVDRIVYPGCDMLALLEELHQIMRVEEMGSIAFEDDDDDA
jgi:methylmalonyl-CoA mutase